MSFRPTRPLAMPSLFSAALLLFAGDSNEYALLGLEIEAGLLALALLLIPPLLGLALGATFARWRGRLSFSLASVAATLVFLVGTASLFTWVATRCRVGAWDGLEIGILFALGLAVGAAELHRHVTRSKLLVASVSTLLALGAGEFAGRLLLPPAPSLPTVSSARVLIPRIDIEHMILPEWHFAFGQMFDACGLAHPKLFPARFKERTRHAAGKPVVLHLGDSMTFGLFVKPEQAFPALLEQRAPQLAHVNAATPGTSVDYHLLVARQWMDLLPVKLLVLNLFMNDVVEIDEGMPCCKDGPLLDYSSGEARERCPVPTFIDGFGETFGWMLHNSPAPYPLRVATGFSDLARHLDVAFMAKVSAIKYNKNLDMEEKWRRFELTVGAIRDEAARRGVPLVAVVLPVRQGLEAQEPRKSDGYEVTERMRTVCEKLGIRTLDPWEHFEELVRRDGAGRYFVAPDDIHFEIDGHVAMADWLAPRLELPNP